MKFYTQLKIAAVLFLLGMTSFRAEAQELPYLNLFFTNSLGDQNLSNTYLSIFNASSNGVGYQNGSASSFTNAQGDVFTAPVSLATIDANGGLAITNLDGGQIWISYGTGLTNLTVQPGNGFPLTGDAATTQYNYFELTRASNNVGGQGDITAINYFTAPMSITSYSSYTDLSAATQLQRAGFNPGVTANQVYASLQQAMGGTNSTGYAANGDPLRIYGPSSASAGTLYSNTPTFSSYITSLSQQFGASNSIATFVNNTADGTVINTSGVTMNGFSNNTTNTLQAYWQMTGSIISNNTVYLTGNITVSNTIAGQPIPSNAFTNFTGLTVAISGTNAVQQTWNLIAAPGVSITTTNYTTNAGIVTTNVVLGTNAGIAFNDQWANYYNWLTNTGLLDTNAPTNGLNPFYGLQSQVIGEVGMGFTAGFVGSTNTNAAYGGGTNPLGQLLSTNWWALPQFAFANAQTNTNNYDQFAGVIAQYSSNTVYGAPYSDRFGTNGPLLQTVQLNNTNVATWVIDIAAPLSVPEPSTYALLLFGASALALQLGRRRRDL